MKVLRTPAQWSRVDRYCTATFPIGERWQALKVTTRVIKSKKRKRKEVTQTPRPPIAVVDLSRFALAAK